MAKTCQKTVKNKDETGATVYCSIGFDANRRYSDLTSSRNLFLGGKIKKIGTNLPKIVKYKDETSATVQLSCQKPSISFGISCGD